MLPEPTLTLTLPSIHDGTVLDCRVFHPYSLSPSPRAPPWQKHAAVMAHPYAPLGGCYDDPVVDLVAATLLRLGFLVATFNFRGASGSAGRTSWTARAERADYMSVVGFVSHYAHHLDPFRPARCDASRPASPPPPEAADTPATATLLLMAGYSYGAMITTQLPGLEAIQTIFSTPVRDTPAAEIRHRAEHLAAAQNEVLGDARAAQAQWHKHKKGTASPRRSLGLRVGGDEDIRRSHDSARRSFSSEAEERFRKGVADLVARAKRGHHHHKGAAGKGGGDGAADVGEDGGGKEPPAVAAAAGDDHLPPLADPPRYRPAYLLISPLQGIITNLATMSFSNPFSKKTRDESPRRTLPSDDGDSRSRDDDGGGGGGGQQANGRARAEAEQKLVRNPTLAVYGDRDVFVSARKMREWTRRLEGYPDSRFRAHEISTASHFWTEERVVHLMRDAVGTFAEGVLQE